MCVAIIIFNFHDPKEDYNFIFVFSILIKVVILINNEMVIMGIIDLMERHVRLMWDRRITRMVYEWNAEGGGGEEDEGDRRLPVKTIYSVQQSIRNLENHGT